MRISRACVLVFLLSGCLSPANGQQERRESNQQAHNADGRPCPPPLVCTPASSGVSQQATNTNSAPAEKKPQSIRQKIWRNILKAFAPELWVNWALAIFAAWAVFVGLRTLKAVVTQAIANTISANAAKTSADAAVETIKTMKDTAERQLRAYVLVTTAQIHRDANFRYKLSVKIKIKNFGATPAYDLTNWMGVDFISWPLPADLGKPENPNENRSTSILGPGDTTELGGPMQSLLVPELEAKIRHGESTIVVWGEIRYRDAFNIQRVTNFRTFCIGENINDGRFAPHDQGNDAT